jgi:hypothetical protein
MIARISSRWQFASSSPRHAVNWRLATRPVPDPDGFADLGPRHRAWRHDRDSYPQAEGLAEVVFEGKAEFVVGA